MTSSFTSPATPSSAAAPSAELPGRADGLDLQAALAPAGVRSVPDLAQASGVIDVPTLVVWGERDGSFPVACLEGLEHWVPDLRVHREPEGGHWLLEEQHALAAGLLRDFLAMPD